MWVCGEGQTQTRSAQHCIPPGSLNRVPALAGGKDWNVTSAGWQVTLCDPIWHVSSSTAVWRLQSANCYIRVTLKGKGFLYSTPSVGSGADPIVHAVSLQVTVSHPPGGRLPLLSARPAVTSPAAEHHRRSAGTKLYCLVTEAHRCKQLA